MHTHTFYTRLRVYEWCKCGSQAASGGQDRSNGFGIHYHIDDISSKGTCTITWGGSPGVEEKDPGMMSWLLNRIKEKGSNWYSGGTSRRQEEEQMVLCEALEVQVFWKWLSGKKRRGEQSEEQFQRTTEREGWLEKAKGKMRREWSPHRGLAVEEAAEKSRRTPISLFSPFVVGEEKKNQDLLPGKETRENLTKSDDSNRLLGFA